MKAIVLAYHNMGCAGLRALLRNGYEIAAVFTHPDDPKENVWFESVAEVAASHGIPVFAPEEINHPIWVERIREMQPDILFSFYYRNLIKPALLDIPTQGCLNLHGSLLPKYRGRVPINWVLVHGEKETGVTLHCMTPRPDDGDIVAQRRVAITEDDTAKTLFDKSVAQATAMLDEVLPQIANGTLRRTPQNHAEASYFGGRKPQDGLIQWAQSAQQVRNLIRAVTRPYPGAFTFSADRRFTIWSAAVLPDPEVWPKNVLMDAPEGSARAPRPVPGTILQTEPPIVVCGRDTLRIDTAQIEGKVFQSGAQTSSQLGLRAGHRLNAPPAVAKGRTRVLILGVNGFIGNALSERLLESDYIVHGMDLQSDKLERLRAATDFHFEEGDIAVNREWIEYHVKKCDVIVPLVAIATPIAYVRDPLRVFNLDFEENLRVVRYCAKFGKRVVFPSTSEVYGMCQEPEFDEDTSNLVLGPVHMQRWIYACSKQLLDRVIWAYGQKEGLKFTLFRPFNFIGPRLDSLQAARIGSSRAITQLILNLVQGTPIQLVDGGAQKRCFVDVRDAMECLFRIIENPGGKADGQIFNIGNPDCEASIAELAQLVLEEFERHPLRAAFPPFAGFQHVESGAYYGAGYQDVEHRRPSIRKARKLLDWTPQIGLREAVASTVNFFLEEVLTSGEFMDPTYARLGALSLPGLHPNGDSRAIATEPSQL